MRFRTNSGNHKDGKPLICLNKKILLHLIYASIRSARGLLWGFQAKVCIKYAAALNGFGVPVHSVKSPMQLILGHSALKLCEIGESRHHVGRWGVRNVPLRFVSTLFEITVGSEAFYYCSCCFCCLYVFSLTITAMLCMLLMPLLEN